MNYIIGYLEYQKCEEKNFIYKVLNKIFFKIKVIYIQNDKIKIIINNKKIGNKRVKKIIDTIKKIGINKIVISEDLKEDINGRLNLFEKYNEKILMKNFIIPILGKFFNDQNIDIRFEDIYITVNDDKNKDIIIDIAQNVKSINMVTTSIKKMRRLCNKLEKEGILFSISNNSQKSLKRAKLIVNFDYNSETFNYYDINRYATIVNLNKEKINLDKCFGGTIIENIKIDYNNENLNLKNYDKTEIYESYICNDNYFTIKEKCNKDKCRIVGFIGKNGYI